MPLDDGNGATRGAGGAGQSDPEHHNLGARAATIDQIVDSYRRWMFCVGVVAKLERATEALIRNFSGWRADLPEKQRKALNDASVAARKAGGKGMAIAVVVHMANAAAMPFALYRRTLERNMEKLARTLPAAGWVSTVKGLSLVGLAKIIAETGDLSGYATKERVWKRMGLAVKDGIRQGAAPKHLSREDRTAWWIEQGYVPRRRALIYAHIAEPLFRAQWCGAKKIEDREANSGVSTNRGLPPGSSIPAAVAHATGPYGAIYARRKAHTAITHPEWHGDPKNHPGHADKDARRVMSKALLADLWRAWNGLPPTAG